MHSELSGVTSSEAAQTELKFSAESPLLSEHTLPSLEAASKDPALSLLSRPADDEEQEGPEPSLAPAVRVCNAEDLGAGAGAGSVCNVGDSEDLYVD